jgi:2,4-dienoyl-CoA reductase-like NADH-dependent reductase (Old Yellow Enzyme family)
MNPRASAKPQVNSHTGGSPVPTSVELLTAYSHSTQAVDLRFCHTMALTSAVHASGSSGQRPWSLRERLDERDITELITAYRNGATAASLAATHGVSLTSVKRLLHTAGVRRSSPPRQAMKATPGATHP